MLPVKAVDVPEHQLRQLVALLLKLSLGRFEVSHIRIICAVVKLHIRHDNDPVRHIALLQAVLYGRFQYQVKSLPDIGIGNLIEAHAVMHLLEDIITLYLDQPRVCRKRDEVVCKRTSVTLGVINTQRLRYRRRTYTPAAIH